MPAGALAIAIVVGGWFVARNAGAGPALDRNVYAVFPLRDEARAVPGELDGAQVADLLSRAMSRWTGVHFVNNMRVTDLWARKRPLTVEDGLRAAERLNAGTLAWGEIVPLGDSLEIHVVTYDVSGGPGASREFTRYLPRAAGNLAQMDSVFAALADSVLVGGRAPPGISVTGTHSLPAFYEFRYGHDALGRFDLRAAQEHFDAAARADENFALAHLWAARLRAWRGEDEPKAWLRDAMQATRQAASLSNNEKVHAYALLDLAEGRSADACQLYRRLVRADETDFAAWLGLGDCNARDDVVVPDSRSPTGYAFRGSFWTAFTSYQRALSLVPSFHQAERGSVFQRLAGRVLITEEAQLRRGVGVPPDTQRYVAFQSFPAETLAFFPVPYRLATRQSIVPPTEHRAVVWAAGTMRDLMREWLDAYPASADAQAAYAAALETASAVAGTTTDLPKALALARRAAAHTDSADLRLYREIAVVRLLVKLDSLGAARRVSDSMLAASRSPTPYQAGYLANLAAFTGQARRAASLLRVAAADSNNVPFLDFDGRRLVLPGELMPNILALRAYAALGAPRDSVRAVYRRVEHLLTRVIPPPRRLVMRSKVLSTPALMSEEDLGAVELACVPNADPLLEMRAALGRRDADAARAAGDRFATRAAAFSPGTVGIDRMTAYATMLLALGDTADAIQRLDDALDAVPRARSILLEATPQAAALGRARLVRAQLAIRAGDGATAQRRLAELNELWSGADPELRAEAEVLRRQL
jgi:tetratricopeptide (TPR) repeat protein